MRLLKLDNGKLSLIKAGNHVPEYAILSHTWGPDGDEVTYEDVIKGTGIDKPGYKKITFCAQQADLDGLRYFWIDTCCINKSSDAELSEAIRSMFRWYRAATRCYVYLSDVPDSKSSMSTTESAFPNSRWFKRGWTLQELIAPKLIYFFSREGEPLGDRTSREQQIHEVTGIAAEALQGKPLSQFSVDVRMSWTARRETTVEEDEAYCLLGIFDIHMPVMYGEGRKSAMDRLQREIQASSNSASALTGAPWIVPFERNPRFTGRIFELAQLEKRLFAKDHTTKIAITGLGGMGKTQLVLELLYQTRDKRKDCSIIWIPVTSAESLHQGYLNVARQLGIPGGEEQNADVKKLVQEYLSKADAGEWLLVFDNADDIDLWTAKTGSEQDLIDYLPKSKQGCIIFTTRDRKAAVKLAQQNIIDVQEMNNEASTQLLKKCLANPDLADNKQDVMALFAALTHLPLAIVQAAAYINENGITLAEYKALLEEKEEEVIDLLSEEFEDDGRYRNMKNPVVTTWLISFKQIRRRDPLAADYLSFMACVDPRDISQSLLPPGPSRKKEIDAIGTLNAYSFVSRRLADLALDLHQLVHLATRNWLRKEGLLAQSTESAIERLKEIFPDDEHTNRSLWRRYLPHARYALESNVVPKDGEKRLALMWKYGTCLYSDGRWNEAEAAFSQILEVERKTLGEEHAETLTSIAWVASTYRNQGRWDAAEELEVQVMETSKKKLGADHPSTLTSIANLASTLWNQGRWDAAEELNVQVMETSKKKLGADHPDTLASIANLASTFWNQGRWDAAEELFMQVIETSKKKLGADHPDTLTSMNNLAFTWRGQGRQAEAMQLMEDCIQLRRRILGDGHPHYLSSYKALAKWQAEEADTGASA